MYKHIYTQNISNAPKQVWCNQQTIHYTVDKLKYQ